MAWWIFPEGDHALVDSPTNLLSSSLSTSHPHPPLVTRQPWDAIAATWR
jgi:hypothetical protein